MLERATTSDWGDSFGDTVLKGDAGTVFSRRLAAGVIARAVQDLAAGDGDARTALLFLFGHERDCAGWLGMIGASVDWAQPRIVRYYEAQRDRYSGMDAQSLARRKRARLALLRIRKYVHRGMLPRANRTSEQNA